MPDSTGFRRWVPWVVAVVAVAALAFVLLGRGSGPGAAAPVGALVVDSPAPGFTATTITGDEVSLSELAGEPVWLVVNATWCASCRSEAPDIQAVHETVGDTATIIAVYAGEAEATVQPFADRLGLTYLQIPDPDRLISTAYLVPGVPVHYLIDGDGVLRHIEFGALGADRILQLIADVS